MDNIISLKEVFAGVLEFLEKDKPIISLETGTSFAWSETNLPYLSSLNIIKYLCLPTYGELYSIDISIDRLNLCEKELYKRGDNFGDCFNKYNGESLEEMSFLLSTEHKFDFFWLDSEENEDHGLKEYELAKQLANDKFVICIDDYNSNGSVKWKKSSELIKQKAKFYKIYNTPTGLIVGFFER